MRGKIDTVSQTPHLKEALTNGTNNIDVIRAYHAWIEAAVKQLPQHVDVTCRAGCSHCCKGSEIRSNQGEAALLMEVTGITANLNVRHVERNRIGEACVFLNATNGECKVYLHRPATCRTAVSVDEAIKCSTEEFRQMYIPDSLYHDLAVQLTKAEYTRLDAAMGMEADLREFFPSIKN